MDKKEAEMDNHECGFTCRACGQFRPGSEGAHSESACLRVQLAAANEQVERMEELFRRVLVQSTAKMKTPSDALTAVDLVADIAREALGVRDDDA
jgi:hypothetical protein